MRNHYNVKRSAITSMKYHYFATLSDSWRRRQIEALYCTNKIRYKEVWAAETIALEVAEFAIMRKWKWLFVSGCE
jgi:hypothetical protein